MILLVYECFYTEKVEKSCSEFDCKIEGKEKGKF